MKMYGRDYLKAQVELPYDEIAFETADGRNSIVVSVRHNQVDVRTEHGRIIIIPQAANCIYVEPEDKN